MTMLAGTVMCLGVDVWRRTGSRAAFIAACAAAGFGLWVHQYIIYYWIALGLAILHSLPQRRKILGYAVAARELPAWLRLLTAAIAAVAVTYVALGAAAFLTGGFDLVAAGIRIGVHHPQKLWNIAAGTKLTPHEALRIATIMGADDLGRAKDVGSLEVGKLADLLVLDANPLTNIRNSNTIRYVMKNGRLYDANTLDEIWPRQKKATFYWQTGEPGNPEGGNGGRDRK